METTTLAVEVVAGIGTDAAEIKDAARAALSWKAQDAGFSGVGDLRLRGEGISPDRLPLPPDVRIYLFEAEVL